MIINKFNTGDVQKIEKVEKIFNIDLPNDYKQFLVEANGGSVEDGYFSVKDLNEIIMMGVFYGIDLGKEKEALDIIYENKEYEEDILKNSLLIGSDAGGGWLLLVFDGENDGIWYYDHTYFFPESTDELNTYFICDTFSDFLKILETTPSQQQ